MKERPIPFSSPMVRAILAGTKTQTRRVVKDCWGVNNGVPFTSVSVGPATSGFADIACRYGAPGDRLWVREAWRAPRDFDDVKPSDLRAPADGLLGTPIVYEATRHDSVRFGKLRPAMFMPRWASRITLEVTGVRVERLQDISEADAQAEGAPSADLVSGRECIFPHQGLHRWGFQLLWQEINGLESWDANPWVWVVEFRRV